MTDLAQPQLQLHHLETTDDEERPAKNPAGRHMPPRPSALPRKSLIKGERGRGGGGAASRRRSSARFLSMGGRNRNGEEDMSHEGLNKMYKQAIKMNTENRINASNSWNFKLIENIDKFLTDDPETLSQRRTSFVSNNSTTSSSLPPPRPPSGLGQQRVNFTKASSTLDASVKIYSYRVDDVHLTSYRVLENLHRSDGDKKKKTQDTTGETDPIEAPEGQQKTHRSRAAVSTVETNVGTLCLRKKWSIAKD